VPAQRQPKRGLPESSHPIGPSSVLGIEPSKRCRFAPRQGQWAASMIRHGNHGLHVQAHTKSVGPKRARGFAPQRRGEPAEAFEQAWSRRRFQAHPN